MSMFSSMPSISVNWKVVLLLILLIAPLIYYVAFYSENAENAESAEKAEKAKEVSSTNGGVYHRQISKPNPSFTVVFLHGLAFNSQTWKDLGTLDYFANLNYNVVALDLPGFGKSMQAEPPLDRAQWLADFFSKLHIDRPVLVSPSMSGSFSIPFVMSGQTAAKDRLRGFIPIAPTSTGKFSKEEYQQLKLPTLIIYGEKDTSLGAESLENLSNIPGSIAHVMKGAKHPCYLDNPEEFHITVHEFLLKFE